jgi:hypothetical protein
LTSSLFKKNSRPLFKLLNTFKSGLFKDIPIKLGRLQEFITAASKIEIPNVAPEMNFHDNRVLASPVLSRKTLSIKSLTEYEGDVSNAKRDSEEAELHKGYSKMFTECQDMEEHDLLALATAEQVTASNIIALIELSDRFGREYQIDRNTVTEIIEHHYKTVEGDWLALRCCAGFLGKTVDSLAPAVSVITVSGRSLSLGVHGQPEILVEGPMHPTILRDILHNKVGSQSLLHASLQQEFLIYIAELLVDHPELFKGILIIRTGSMIHVLQSALVPSGPPLEALPPHLLSKKIRNLLAHNNDSKEGSWQELRLINGTLGRVPEEFSSRVWLILQHQTIRFYCNDGCLVSNDTLNTKVSEPFFAMKIERFLNCFSPHFRHFVIELFHVLSATLGRNPEVHLVENFPVKEFIEKSEVLIDESFEAVSKKFIDCLIKFEFVKLANYENCIVS